MDIFPETLWVFLPEVMDGVQNVCRVCCSTPCSEHRDTEQTVYSVIRILIIIIIISMVVVKLMFCLALSSVPRSASSMSFLC
jgi:hypothetical protein